MSESNAFIGFTYNGKHSIDDLHIYRVSDGSRYNDNITPTLTDKTAEIPNADGMFFFNSYHKEKTFSVNIAFDDLSENGLRLLRQTFNGKGIHELIFDEEPNKVWNAKVTGTPNLKYICFDERVIDSQTITNYIEGNVTFYHMHDADGYTFYYNGEIRDDPQSSVSDGNGKWNITVACSAAGTGDPLTVTLSKQLKERVYKGEGTLQFTCYWPYAHSVDLITANAGTTSYSLTGDLPAPFVTSSQYQHGPAQYVIQIKQANGSWEDFASIEVATDIRLYWDSRTGLVQHIDSNTGKKTPARYTGNSICYIPVNTTVHLITRPLSSVDQPWTQPLEIYNWYY